MSDFNLDKRIFDMYNSRLNLLAARAHAQDTDEVPGHVNDAQTILTEETKRLIADVLEAVKPETVRMDASKNFTGRYKQGFFDGLDSMAERLDRNIAALGLTEQSPTKDDFEFDKPPKNPFGTPVEIDPSKQVGSLEEIRDEARSRGYNPEDNGAGQVSKGVSHE